ncbi:DNA/RNA non-specific endonuclease [Kitasatospora sp. NPDC004289]
MTFDGIRFRGGVITIPTINFGVIPDIRFPPGPGTPPIPEPPRPGGKPKPKPDDKPSDPRHKERTPRPIDPKPQEPPRPDWVAPLVADILKLAVTVYNTAELISQNYGEQTAYAPTEETSAQAGPGSGTGSDSEDDRDNSCRRNGKGWTDYGTRDAANGNRATAVNACLDKEWIAEKPGSSTTKEIRPPGYNWAGRFNFAIGNGLPRNWINNCHLLGASLGGSGTDLDNLVTCSRAANANRIDPRDPGLKRNMADFERDVKVAVDAGQIVRYTVNPKYEGSRTVPIAFEMTAVGVNRDGTPGINLPTELIPNDIWSVGNNQWENVGRGIDQNTGLPVPVGSMG